MKNLKNVVLGLLVLAVTFLAFKSEEKEEVDYQWRQMTVIESVVPAGLGRSRLITTDENGKMEETKLQNFFSVAGINFGNVRDNDLEVTNKISTFTANDWELFNVTAGVYSGSGAGGDNGIYVTRYLFRKPKTNE